MKGQLITAAGAGGFIGGHLVADLLARGCTNIRAIDIKPFDEWYQRFDEAENVIGDLREKGECRAPPAMALTRCTTSPMD